MKEIWYHYHAVKPYGDRSPSYSEADYVFNLDEHDPQKAYEFAKEHATEVLSKYPGESVSIRSLTRL